MTVEELDRLIDQAERDLTKPLTEHARKNIQIALEMGRQVRHLLKTKHRNETRS